MISSYRLDDGRIVEADVRPGQAICCSCGEVYDYRASQRGRHVCSPTQLGEPAMTPAEAIERLDDSMKRALAASMNVKLPEPVVHYHPKGWDRFMCGSMGTASLIPKNVTCVDCLTEAASRGMIPQILAPPKIDSHAYPVAPDICPECGLTKLPGYDRCYYCEQLATVQVRNSAQLAAYDAEMERLHRPRQMKLTRRDVPPILVGCGAALSMAPGWWSEGGMAVAATGLLGIVLQSGGPRR